MEERYIGYIITGIVTATLGATLRHYGQKAPEVTQYGSTIHKPSKIYGYIGWCSVILAGVIFIIAMVTFSIENIGWQLALCGIFSLPGVPLIFFGKNYRIETTSEEIHYYGWFGKKKTLKWSEISEVEYKPNLHELRIRGKNTKISASQYLSGFAILSKTVVEKTGRSHESLNIP